MKQTPLAPKSDTFAGHLRPPGSIWTHSYSGTRKSPPHHPQVREHKHGEELRRVLLNSAIAHLGVTKLALDNPKRVFHLGADTGLELFDLVQCGAQRTLFIQYAPFSWAHGYVPVDLNALDFFALGYALIAGICIGVSLIAIHECVRLGYVIDIGSCANHRVYQARVGVGTDVKVGIAAYSGERARRFR